MPEHRKWTCPHCKRDTYHPKDIEHKYCPCCGNDEYPTGCEHVSTALYITQLLGDDK